jgi:hypothetical protein
LKLKSLKLWIKLRIEIYTTDGQSLGIMSSFSQEFSSGKFSLLIFSKLTRLGITQKLPFGKSWKQVKGLTVFSHSTIGRGVVFGIDSLKNIYRGSLTAVGGKH